MKIAINGEIIDTENIYKIGKIITGYWEYGEDDNWFVERNGEPTARDTNIFTIKFLKGNEIGYQNDDLIKIKKFRDSIIKIWSENQSTIPQFNLE